MFYRKVSKLKEKYSWLTNRCEVLYWCFFSALRLPYLTIKFHFFFLSTFFQFFVRFLISSQLNRIRDEIFCALLSNTGVDFVYEWKEGTEKRGKNAVWNNKTKRRLKENWLLKVECLIVSNYRVRLTIFYFLSHSKAFFCRSPQWFKLFR